MVVLFFFEKFWRRPDLSDCAYIFFGLGNPGKKYRSTRHNIGFLVLERLEKKCAGPSRGRCGRAAVVVGMIGTKKVALVKPLTFVNKSGIALRQVLAAAGGVPDKAVVIVDDFNIGLGAMRLRRNGSHGGHNGLKSCIAAVGENFPRMRVGVGPLPAGISVIDFVLGDFEKAQRPAAEAVISRAAEALVYLCEHDFNAAMNVFNK